MKHILVLLLIIAGAPARALDTGPARRIAATAGSAGRAQLIQIDLSQTGYFTNQLPLSKGGTGIASCASGSVGYSNGTTLVCDTSLTITTSNGTLLTIGSAGSNFTDAAVSLRSSNVGRGAGTFYSSSGGSGENWYSGILYNGTFTQWVLNYRTTQSTSFQQDTSDPGDGDVRNVVKAHSSGSVQFSQYGKGVLETSSTGVITATNVWTMSARTSDGADCDPADGQNCADTASVGGGFSSITKTATGIYTVNFSGSFWSAAPLCVANDIRGSGFRCNLAGSTTTSAAPVRCYDSAGALVASRFSIQCQGARQ